MTGELGKKMTSNKYFLPAIRIPTRVTYIRSKNSEAQTIVAVSKNFTSWTG